MGTDEGNKNVFAGAGTADAADLGTQDLAVPLAQLAAVASVSLEALKFKTRAA